MAQRTETDVRHDSLMMIKDIYALVEGLTTLHQRWRGPHRPEGLEEHREYLEDVLEVMRAHRGAFQDLATMNGLGTPMPRPFPAPR